MEIAAIVLVIGILLAGLGATALVVAAGARRHPRGLDTTAVADAVSQLIETNRALMAAERERAGEALAGQQTAVAAQVSSMREDLGRVTELVKEFETQRGAKLDALGGALANQQEGIAELARTTQGLREALSSTKARGQWGERMAEDVLRLAGFVEGIQYRKQKAVASGTGIPDFTFLLPRDTVLYMDVKFPLDNYQRYLEAEAETDAHRYRDAFLRDVRAKVGELADRQYAASSEESVECVLLFIPNEALYAFIHEHDDALADTALTRGIVLCSPLTLFAVLAVVRQAVDSFRVERTAGQILDVLADFSKQWGAFTEKMEKVGRGIESASRAYDELSTTRTRQMERRLDRIATLRAEATLTLVDDDPPLAPAPPLALDA